MIDLTREQLIEALYAEYQFLIHDDYNPDEDPTPEEYLEMLKNMTYEELLGEIVIENDIDLIEFVRAYGVPHD